MKNEQTPGLWIGSPGSFPGPPCLWGSAILVLGKWIPWVSFKLQASPPLQNLNLSVSTLICVIPDFLKKGFKKEKENYPTLTFSINIHCVPGVQLFVVQRTQQWWHLLPLWTWQSPRLHIRSSILHLQDTWDRCPEHAQRSSCPYSELSGCNCIRTDWPSENFQGVYFRMNLSVIVLTTLTLYLCLMFVCFVLLS